MTYELARAGDESIPTEDDLATLRYRLDASQSNFMVRAFSGGLLWFKLALIDLIG